MKKIVFALFIALLLSCSSTPQESSSDKKIFLSKIEYYFDYIGKPVPLHFKPMNKSSNIYVPPDNQPTVGKEIVSLGVKNSIVDRVFVFCIFDNESEYEDWFRKYINDAKKLGFNYSIDNENIYFAKDQYVFVFTEKNSDKLYGGQIDFFITK